MTLCLEPANPLETGGLRQRLGGNPGPVDAGVTQRRMFLVERPGLVVRPGDDDRVGRLQVAANLQPPQQRLRIQSRSPRVLPECPRDAPPVGLFERQEVDAWRGKHQAGSLCRRACRHVVRLEERRPDARRGQRIGGRAARQTPADNRNGDLERRGKFGIAGPSRLRELVEPGRLAISERHRTESCFFSGGFVNSPAPPASGGGCAGGRLRRGRLRRRAASPARTAPVSPSRKAGSPDHCSPGGALTLFARGRLAYARRGHSLRSRWLWLPESGQTVARPSFGRPFPARRGGLQTDSRGISQRGGNSASPSAMPRQYAETAAAPSGDAARFLQRYSPAPREPRDGAATSIHIARRPEIVVA